MFICVKIRSVAVDNLCKGDVLLQHVICFRLPFTALEFVRLARGESNTNTHTHAETQFASDKGYDSFLPYIPLTTNITLSSSS